MTSSVNYITTHAPTPNGFLKSKLHYVFQFEDFDELRQKGMCIPDGLILNENRKIMIVSECKSTVVEEKDAEPRLVNQIRTYSSEDFHSLISKLFKYNEYEIVILTFSSAVKEIIYELRNVEQEANIVVWCVEEPYDRETVSILKTYGKHIDNELEKVMSIGVSCEPPAREFIDPDMPEQRISFILGCRLLNTYGECQLKKNMVVKPSEFRKGNLDLVLSENKLRHFFRVLHKLIPELCEYESKSGNVILRRRLDHEKVSSRLLQISAMSTPEYRTALGFPVEEKPYKEAEKAVEEVIKPRRIPKLTEIMWGRKES